MRFQNSGPQDGKIPPEAYQLADHLDAALAAAEDLADAGRQWVPATSSAGFELAAQMAAERQVIERVCMFETMLIGRVLKARNRAQMLAHTAGDFTGMTRLFVAGTAALLDAVEELGDSTRADFETGNCIMAYLRQRGVIAEDAADLPENRSITLGGDTFLVAGRIALAPLSEVIIAFLDALDMHYHLYPDEPDGTDPFGWPEVVGAVRPSEHLLSSPAPVHQAVDATSRDDLALSDVRQASAPIAHAPECGKAHGADRARQQTGEDVPSKARPPVPTNGTRSLVERLDEVARAHD